MTDEEIIRLYINRSETAISESKEKYEAYLMKIADNILHDMFDNEECVNDTYLKTWESIPPALPKCLRAFMGKITRNIALNRIRDMKRNKRVPQDFYVSLDELEDIIPSYDDTNSQVEVKILVDVINTHLGSITAKKRVAFVRRYWYFDSIKEIAARIGTSESSVKMILKRERDTLREKLSKEGFYGEN